MGQCAIKRRNSGSSVSSDGPGIGVVGVESSA